MASTVWRGHLTFGLVSFPVRLHIAARRERVRMHYVHRSQPEAEELKEVPEPEQKPGSRGERAKASETNFRPNEAKAPDLPVAQVARLRQEFIAPKDERTVPRQEVLKGYEVAPERYVTFTNEELRQLRPATSPDMQILRSVRLADIDPVFFETSYYVVPEGGGERAYALLYAALQQSQLVALAKVAMHGREHIMVVRPGRKGLLAHTMYYNDEIRAGNEFQINTSDVAPKELELAKSFVEAIAGPFSPEEFKDSYRENIQSLISKKVEGKQVAESSPAPETAAAPVVNILDALKKSLEIAKKPAQTEGPSRRAPGKVTELKPKAQRRKG